MNLSNAREVTVKDLQEMSKNRYVFFAMIFLPAILVGVTVYVTYTVIGSYGTGVTASEVYPVLLPTLQTLLFIPAIITVLIGSTSVVIEKNNRSLEPLLATPISDAELLLGKSLAPFLPALAVTYAGYAAAIGLIDYVGYGPLHVFLLPTRLLVYEIVVLVPILGLFGTFASLFVSSKVKDVRAAQQLSTFTVLPLLLAFEFLSNYIASNVFWLELLSAVLAVGVVVIAELTIRRFKRESILVSWS
jgi:ABC-2 type transport system permease protein